MPLPHELLAAALGRELAATREFDALLDEEHQDLLAARADRLEQLAIRKSALAREIAERVAQRDAALQRAGLPAGRRGLEEVGRAGPRGVVKLLAELRTCAQRVRERCDDNRMLVDRRLAQVGAALAVLMSGAKSPQLYSPDGRLSAVSPGRVRGTA